MKMAAGLALGLALTSLSAVAEQKACEVTGADSAAIVEAVRTMFVAAKTDDVEKFHSITSRDFYAFDNGKRFEGDGLMALILTAHSAGKVYEWSVTEPKVYVGCDVAWLSYVNQGSVTDKSGTIKLTWLESAGLVKEKGGWRIQFLNSARMAP